MSRRHKTDDWGIFGTGPYRVEVCVGSGKSRQRVRGRFPAGTPKADMRAWRNRELLKLEAQLGPKTTAAPDTLNASIPIYFRTATLTPTTRHDRTNYCAWWAAQS